MKRFLSIYVLQGKQWFKRCGQQKENFKIQGDNDRLPRTTNQVKGTVNISLWGSDGCEGCLR